MSDFSELSDFEINKRVRLAIGKSISYTDKGRVLIPCTNKVYRAFDPCNNPEDAWPLILESGIGIKQNFSNDAWIASPRNYDDGHMTQVDDNPLRAAMICYLMMKEVE